MGGGRRIGVCSLVRAIVAVAGLQQACSDDKGSSVDLLGVFDSGTSRDLGAASFDKARDLPMADYAVDLGNRVEGGDVADAAASPDGSLPDAAQASDTPDAPSSAPDSAVIVDAPTPQDIRLRPDVANAPAMLRGTPLVVDPGSGPAREAAGFYRLAFEAFAAGLSFPERPRTIVDFYFASTLEIWSTGLGGRIRPLENAPRQALVFRLPFGDELDLVLDTARIAPHDFLQAFLRERGQTRQIAGEGAFPYPGVVNRIAAPPFRGGPAEAPAAALVPPLFALAQVAGSGVTLLTCTAATRPLADGGAPASTGSPNWRSGGTYKIDLRPDGSLTLTSETVAVSHGFDERYDTHAWPNGGITSVRLVDRIRSSETAVAFDQSKGGVQEVVHTVTIPGLFATYVFSRK